MYVYVCIFVFFHGVFAFHGEFVFHGVLTLHAVFTFLGVFAFHPFNPFICTTPRKFLVTV